MESHEPMKCHTESSIATLVPRAVGLSSYFFSDALSLPCPLFWLLQPGPAPLELQLSLHRYNLMLCSLITFTFL